MAINRNDGKAVNKGNAEKRKTGRKNIDRKIKILRTTGGS